MRTYRRHTGTAIAFALSLVAQAADAAVTVDILQPNNAIIDGGTVPVRVAASSPEDIYYVEAEFEGLTIELAPTGDGYFEGAFDLGELGGDLPYGPYVVTVNAYSTLGEAASDQGTVHQYAPPIIAWNVLPHETLTAGKRFDAKCIPTPPYECRSLAATFHSDAGGGYALFAERDWPYPQPVPGRLYIKEGAYGYSGAIPSGRTYTITIEASDYVGPTITKTIGPIYVDRSPRLTAVQRAPGSILDFDATRFLFVDHYRRLGIFDRNTQEVTWVETLTHTNTPISAVYGALTPSGSVHQSTTGVILAWVDGVRRTISSVNNAPRLDAVNGDTVVWTAYGDDRAFAHSLSTGTNRSLWHVPGSRSPFQADVSASGDIFFGTYERASIVGPGNALLGDHAGNLQRPITDGTNVVGRWWDGLTSSSYLYTADGEEVFLGDSLTNTSAGLLAHAGYAAFLKSDGDVNQVWLRTPDGEQHPLSDFPRSSRFDQAKLRVGHDGISDTGEVLFLNEDTRYLGRSGGAPEPISTALGHGRWVDGSWHVAIGNTLFQVSSTEVAVARLATPGIGAFAPAEGLGEPEEPSTSFAEDAALDSTVWARDLHEPDALPALDDGSLLGDVDEDTGADIAPAGAGCSTSGPAGSTGGVAALAAALAGLALARRGRARP
ncbi:hypothetical protein WME75_21210 [Sorangium sp. So ce1014]|uniref:hypothetical protein n=1 Tax=Sorangium sp. So ce1014 TaxID=3133326 RepID=UPI003F5EA192